MVLALSQVSALQKGYDKRVIVCCCYSCDSLILALRHPGSSGTKWHPRGLAAPANMFTLIQGVLKP